MKAERLKKNIFESVLVTLTSFVVLLIIVTFVVFYLFPFSSIEKFIIALAIVVPSISIISVMVMQYELLERKTGQLIISSVIITDIVAFVILATVSQSISKTFSLVLWLGVFLISFIGADRILSTRSEAFRKLLSNLSRLLKREYVSFTILILFGLFDPIDFPADRSEFYYWFILCWSYSS